VSDAVKVGNEAARVFGPITRTDVVRYAGASGDFNPIHHDDEFAAKAGYPSVFSIGMFQAALLATFATDWLGAEKIRRYAVRFRDQVWPGDELTCEGRIESVSENAIEVALVCKRQTGTVAVTATASFAR